MDKSAQHLTSPKSVQYVAWRRFFKTGRLLRATSMSMTLLMLVCTVQVFQEQCIRRFLHILYILHTFHILHILYKTAYREVGAHY